MKKAAKKLRNYLEKFSKLPKPVLFLVLLLVVLLVVGIFAFICTEPGKEFLNIEDDESEIQEEDEDSSETEEETFEAATFDPERDEETETIALAEDEPIYDLKIDADVTLPEPDSLVRVILEDQEGQDYLVLESFPLLYGAESFSVSQACEETCFLDGIAVKRIDVYTENDASIDITKISENTKGVNIVTAEVKETQKEALLDQKVDQLNEEIAKNNLEWTAGKTSFAKLSYEEKETMFEGEVPNLQGAEFYTGGVFEITGESGAGGTIPTFAPSLGNMLQYPQDALSNIFSFVVSFLIDGNFMPNLDFGAVGGVKAAASSDYVSAWDWREIHGADDPASAYFDGNPDSQETGNGWITEIKDQRSCGSCWAFAVTGATESLVNLYYNNHVDLDLSEQDALSCSGAGSCSGGWPGITLNYYTSTGVVDEACFPYTATNQSCGNKCAWPIERIKISGKITFSNKTNDNLKKLILENGPISGGVYSWSHAMTLVGWYTDGLGDPVWIFKNSWGKDWGSGGYLYLKTSISNIGWTHALVLPIVDQNWRTIRCVDLDGDGYYNWGLSSSKPASCPGGIPAEKDCDDSDNSKQVFDATYACGRANTLVFTPQSNYSFGGVPNGQISTTKEIPIQNGSDGSLDVTNIQIQNPGHFDLDLNPAGSNNPCGNATPTIAADDSCDVEITLTPDWSRTYNTQLIVSYDDGGPTSFVVPITGYGTTNPQTVCSYFEGAWDGGLDKCFRLEESDCSNYNGTINPCDSNCPAGQTCPQECIQSCEF